MRRRFNFPSNGNNPESPKEPEIDVVRHTIGAMHWYEAVVKETRQHLHWWKSVTHYTGRGKPMPPALLNWYAEKGTAEAERLKKEGGYRGTAVHRAQELLSQGREIRSRDFAPEVVEHIMSFARWYEDFQPRFIDRETIVHNPDLGVGGTLDLSYVLPAKICEERLKLSRDHIRDDIDGIFVVADTKTGKYLDEDAYIQTNEYAGMKNDLGIDPRTGVPVEWIALLRTNSKHKATYEFVLEPVSEHRREIFRCMKAVVDHFEPMDMPRFPKELPDSISLPLPQNGDVPTEPVVNGSARQYQPRRRR